MADALGAPVRVSPLIKFGRWSLLIAGIFYGSTRHAALAKKEKVVREIEEKQKAIRNEKLKEEKARLNKEELANLGKITGVQL